MAHAAVFALLPFSTCGGCARPDDVGVDVDVSVDVENTVVESRSCPPHDVDISIRRVNAGAHARTRPAVALAHRMPATERLGAGLAVVVPLGGDRGQTAKGTGLDHCCAMFDSSAEWLDSVLVLALERNLLA